MRLVSFDAGGRPSAALLRDGRVYEITGYQRVDDGTLDAILAAGRLDDLRAEDEGVPVEEVTLLPPVTRPGKIVCVGLNYRSHAVEQGEEPPTTPTFFAKFPNALAAPGGTVKLPAWTGKVDYEAEVAFVIGERAKDVPEGDAMNYVAGYTLLNDLSARDYQFKTPRGCRGRCSTGPRRAGRRW